MRVPLSLPLALAAASVAGAQSYAPSTDYATTCFPLDVEWADVDGDGRPDLLSTAGASVEVRLTNADGTLAAPISFVPNSYLIQDIECADVDGDGDLDVLTTHPFAALGPTAFQVTRNQMNVNPLVPFSGSVAGLTFPANVPNDAVFFDADLDGNPDLAITDTAGGTVAIYLHGGSGTPYATAPTVVTLGASPGEIQACDLDGDTLVDLVTCNAFGTTRSLSVLRNGLPGVFMATTVPLPTAASATPRSQAVCVDVDADGLIDVVATHPAGVTYANLNVPAGPSAPFTFMTPTDVAGLTGAAYSALDAGDADGDGDLDLFTAQAFGTTTVEVLTLAAGTFTSTMSLTAPSFVADLEIADHDADGDLDFAVSTIASASSCGLSVFGAARYLGTPDTLTLTTNVAPSVPSSSGPYVDVKPITNGETLQVRLSDPAATFSTGLLYVQGNPTGTPLTQSAPGVWFTAPPAVLLLSGPLPQAYSQAIPASPSLLGTSLWFQGYSISAAAANGSYAATTVHEFRFF